MSDPFFPRDDAEFYKKRCEQLEARLEGGKTLPEKWRKIVKGLDNDIHAPIGLHGVNLSIYKLISHCADELEEAMK